ncbi:MAG: PIN domain-containing protein [Candidatus Krumholzibacteriia bacterium]
MIVVIDTDVVLDVLLRREPVADAAARLMSRAERGDFDGFVCATTVTNLYYLMAKAAGAARVRREIKKLLSFLEVAPVTRTVVESALEDKHDNFEDGVISEAARNVGARAIATRNIRTYKGSKVRAYLPAEIIEMLDAGGLPPE